MKDATIQQDVETNDSADYSLDDASELFLKRWKVADKTPTDADDGNDDTDSTDDETVEQSDDEDTNEQDDTTDDEEGTDEDQSDTDDEGEGEETFADDNAKIKVVVDGEEKTVSVKDLKRLAGQEASLTRKSQEVAAKRKEADDLGAKHLASLAQMAKYAEDDYRPYANIDFILAARELNKEDYAELRKDAEAKYERYRFLTQELDGFMKEAETQRINNLKAQAAEAHKILSDPETGIKDWSAKLYGEIGAYAVKQGIDQKVFDTIVDPVVIRILHKAMMHDQVKTVATKKKAAAPKKVLKSTRSAPNVSVDKAKKAMQKLKASGDRNSATEALLAKWGISEND